MNVEQILKRLEKLGSAENVAGMARYGIITKKAFGVSAPDLKKLAKEIGRNHALAGELWKTRNHDARALAYLIDDPKQVTARQMETWVKDFDNWAICDSCCGHLFSYTPFAYEKIFLWAKRKNEFEKRAAFALIAWLTVHDKKASDEKIAALLPIIEQHANDERNFIRKAVNWALRQIGKRNLKLNKMAIETAKKIQKFDSKSARWIAADALRELQNETTQERLKKKLATDGHR